jgi:hypothetical protein
MEKTAKCFQPFEVQCANIKSGVNFDVVSYLLHCMSRAILVGLNAQDDCLAASRSCTGLNEWMGGGFNNVRAEISHYYWKCLLGSRDAKMLV